MERQRHQFLFLLISLGLLILVTPLFLDTPLIMVVINFIITFILVASVFEVRSESRMRTYTAITLAALAVIVHIIFILTSSVIIDVFDAITSMIFLAYISILILICILDSRKITASLLYGAICIYLLIGLFFMEFYFIIVSFDPNAIMMPHSLTPFHFVSDRFTLATLSYAILTTVGHEDMIIINTFAKSIVIIEQLAGILYLATLVARLVVGLSISKERY